jgi:hypothetical protein
MSRTRADHFTPSTVEVRNDGGMLPLSHMSPWHSACLIKQRDDFTFTCKYAAY